MKKMLLMSCSIFCALNSPLWVSASEDFAGPGSNSYDHYFTVSDEEKKFSVEMDPFSAVEEIFASETIQEIKGQAYNLLKLVYHNENFGTPSEPYRRLAHFGTWTRDSRDGKCYNTRGRILIRDSKTAPQFGANPCTVTGGEWNDPYTGETFYRASEIQIDHFVPLKNAYVSGAWQWNKAKRCLYGNFTSNGYHLISVMGRENMRKGDRGPENYMPPNPAYACQYVAQWLKVKMIWNLRLNPYEEKAVENIVKENSCNPQSFTMSASELRSQRQAILDNDGLCASSSAASM